MRLGVPKEIYAGERRVAATPESVKKLRAMGLDVVIERTAGTGSGYTDEAYEAVGATMADAETVWGESDVVIKVRPPSHPEVAKIKDGAMLVSLLQPERDDALPALLAARRVSAIALERVPRVTRAQKMDVLSSMANLAGYRAVLEAAHHYQGFFGPQVTAAGTMPPARVLVIGAGVAGLAAVAAAKALGAEVRAFDTRKATKEQIESLGATFLTVEIEEDGEGGGGYAKEMSPAFIEAEMALFRKQASEVDVIVTTALVPGKKAPVLVKEEAVAKMKRGSVIVDLAAEQGGNCELCVPGEIVERHGVTIVGVTDLASRMGASASRLFANNVVHLLAEIVDGAKLYVDLEDDVIRPALVTHAGEVLPRPAPKPVAPPPRASTRPRVPPAPEAKPAQKDIRSPTRRAWGTTVGGMVVIVTLFVAGRFAPSDLLQHSTVFILACFVGWQVIWSVTAALHTPLMSVTNAISGIIIIGGMLQVSSTLDAASVLGALAALFAAINIAGGFLVTERMLRMFRREPSAGDARSKGHSR
ncbi:MAG: NAD(P) transhydrogenase subunit alpha [Myxococcales bacterium 68-20]|nr:Re/Si-specific NAD(P)(+) transhydrogenase subunit alpha [Myxococcales bacterium]OJY24573.1 MAG: NAD(P) transhydrogenase subunit alpha [Myxococcales bacterium 68-20]